MSSISESTYVQLYEANNIPLRVVLASLVWVLYEYLITLDEEVHYIWRQQRNLGRFMYLWVRYYTIFLLGFDTVQIHTFAIPGVATHALCVAADPATRIVGAVSLWSIEIIMQMRLYVLYNRSKKVVVLIFNAVLFLGSIGSFLWLVVVNAVRRAKLLRQIHTTSPLPGCPVINGGTEWAQWIPATAFEMVLFSFAIYRATLSIAARTKLNNRLSLTTILINENIFYFCVVSWVLIFNNLMVIGKTNIPWFGFGPFHAAVGIATCRMLMHLRKFAKHELDGQGNATTKATKVDGSIVFRDYEREGSQGSTTTSEDQLAGP